MYVLIYASTGKHNIYKGRISTNVLTEAVCIFSFDISFTKYFNYNHPAASWDCIFIVPDADLA